MTESDLHRLLKAAAIRVLKRQDFNIYLEPEWSPLELLAWARYRPDILAARRMGEGNDYALVECEIKPRLQRILAKNTQSITVQATLRGRTKLSKILVIPSGTLKALDMKIRRNWTIWVVSPGTGEVKRTIKSVGADSV
ncbi:MAG: hypothetical protein ACE5KG_07015 [Nitrososphaerales archaeon]